MFADDRVLLGADPQRDVFVGDAAHDVVEGRRIGIDERDGVGDHRARQRLALLTVGLVALVEHAQQLGMGGEHAGVEMRRDPVGVGGDDGRGR